MARERVLLIENQVVQEASLAVRRHVMTRGEGRAIGLGAGHGDVGDVILSEGGSAGAVERAEQRERRQRG
jgi:hypothetical protein